MDKNLSKNILRDESGSMVASMMVLSASLVITLQAAQMLAMSYTGQSRANIRTTMRMISNNYQAILQNQNYRSATIQNLTSNLMNPLDADSLTDFSQITCADPMNVGISCGPTPYPSSPTGNQFVFPKRIDLAIQTNPAVPPINAWNSQVIPGGSAPLNGFAMDGSTRCANFNNTAGQGNPACPFSIRPGIQIQCSGSAPPTCAPLFQLTVLYNSASPTTRAQMVVQFR